MSEIIKCPACNMIVAKCDCDELRTELAIRNDLIRRLKEDAEMLYNYKSLLTCADDADVTEYYKVAELHRALMKELEDKR